MTLKLYSMTPGHQSPSPPVRAVLLLAKALGVELDVIELDLFQQEHLGADFLQLNPQHTVPTLVLEDGKAIWDSHAILPYLAEKYAKDDSVYPKDAYKRALITQRLHFDSGILFPYLRSTAGPILFDEAKNVPTELAAKMDEYYGYLDTFLKDDVWLVGDKVTIADLSLITTVTSIDVLVPLDNAKFPNVAAWIKRAQSLLYYSPNQEGLEVMKQMLLSKMA